MKRSMLTTAALSMAMAMLSLAATGADSPAHGLTGTNRVLVRLSGSEVEPGPAITLRLEADGTLGGSDGCNRYGGTYTVEGTAVRIPDKLMGTRMACPAPIEDRAGRYARALVQAASFSIDDRQLVLRDSSGSELAVFETDSVELAGSAWTVIGYNNGKGAVTSVLAGTQLTLGFGDDGRITGSTGCNRYFAAYRQTGESIAVDAPASTRRACAEPTGAMEQESAFLAALASAASLRLEAGRLVLRTAAGAIALDLERHP